MLPLSCTYDQECANSVLPHDNSGDERLPVLGLWPKQEFSPPSHPLLRLSSQDMGYFPAFLPPKLATILPQAPPASSTLPVDLCASARASYTFKLQDSACTPSFTALSDVGLSPQKDQVYFSQNVCV